MYFFDSLFCTTIEGTERYYNVENYYSKYLLVDMKAYFSVAVY